MKKQLSERQIWQIWINEYKRWLSAGFNHSGAVLRADAAVSAKRAQLREAAAEPDAQDQMVELLKD